MNAGVSFIFMLCLLVLVTLNEAKPRYKSGRMGRFQFPFSEESEESKESTEEALCTQNCKITNIGNGYKNRNEFHCEIATTPVKARLSVAAYLENKYDKIIQWMKAWSAHEQDTTLSCCRSLHVKHAAYASALYTLNISILVVLLYSWRIGVNAKRFKELDDVYYGVQIAYFAIIGTQMFMIVLSIFLFYGIYKENVAFLVPWVVGCMTFMALEAMAMVYSNILRDHVNKQFDAICKAEVLFLIPRVLLNCLCIWCVLRLYHLLRAGITWKGSAAIEL